MPSVTGVLNMLKGLNIVIVLPMSYISGTFPKKICRSDDRGSCGKPFCFCIMTLGSPYTKTARNLRNETDDIKTDG